MYAVIEGIDTAGKSTQIEILKSKFPDAILTKEPGGTELGLKLRTMALGGEAKCKENGKLKLEGKDYVVQDGDVMHFLFNV